MKRVSVKDIRDINPCYDPGKFRYFKEDWTGTALDVLRATELGVTEKDYAADRLFVVLRPEFIDEKTLLLFTVWCLRNVNQLVVIHHSEMDTGIDMAERFAHGQASRGTFKKAWKAAGYPDWDAGLAWLAAREARRVVSWSQMREKLIEILESYER